jgi:hypothetical protein
MANRPRRHHIQSRVLLKQFADGDQIAVVNKFTSTWRTMSTRKASVVRDANTLRVSSGLDFSLEEALSKVESYYPQIISSLDNTIRKPAEDAFILALISTQMARDPFQRAWIGEDVASIYSSLRAALLENNPAISAAEIEEEIRHYAKANVVKPHIGTSPSNVAIAGTIWLIQAIYASLQPYWITILRAPASSFITADSPTSLFDRYELAGTAELTKDQAFHEETELVFPITSQHVALITRDKLKPLLDVSSDIVAIVNARTVRFAAQHIYCHPAYPKPEMQVNLSTWWWRRSLIDQLQ